VTYRRDIDGLRAVAVAAVVAFHADPRLLPGGFVGVDVFLVISGYLITSLVAAHLEEDSFSLARFYAQRVRRLLPALLIVLATALAVGWGSLLVTEYRQLGAHVASSAAFVTNVVLWREGGYFDVAADRKPLLHLWSLAVEEQFYLVWPLLLRVAWGRVRLTTLAATVVVLSLTMAVTGYGGSAAAFYLPHTRLWELAAGGFLALISARPSPRSNASALWRGHLLSTTGLLLILGAAYGLSGTADYPGWRALVPTAGALLVIAAGEVAWWNRVVLGSSPFVWLGLVSYPLYLWHWPALTYLRQVSVAEPTAAERAAVVAGAIVLSWLVYLVVERPTRRLRVGWPAVLTTTTLIVLLGAVGAAGAYIWQEGESLPPRFPARLQAVESFRYSYEEDYREGRCYLMPDAKDATLASECLQQEPASQPLVVVWGDSHAAHLVPGLRRLQTRRPFRLAQWTGARCPPFPTASIAEPQACAGLNAGVMRDIARWRPAVVVVAARWPLYDAEPLGPPLRAAVTALRALGVPRIVVVGPAPNWTTRVPRILFNVLRRHPLSSTPAYVLDGLVPSFRESDRDLREAANTAGAVYASAVDALCRVDGCLVAVDGAPARLTTWDDSHLTADGSSILVERLESTLFPAPTSGGEGGGRGQPGN
jgi:peptidoglycan/LPS O-acetylase OafA/YrhL